MFNVKSNPNANGTGPKQYASILGPDLTIEGSLDSAGEVSIGGTLRGDIKAAAVVIEAGGTVEGRVMADLVVVHGRVQGTIIGRNVQLMAGARVTADVNHGQLSLQWGAQLSGECLRLPNDVAPAAEVDQKRVAVTLPAGLAPA